METNPPTERELEALKILWEREEATVREIWEAMVAAGAGWTILTPLALLHAERFRDQADVLPLPFAPMKRTISLTARKDVLQEIPAQTANRLRPLLQELVVRPSIAQIPWLDNSLRINDN